MGATIGKKLTCVMALHPAQGIQQSCDDLILMGSSGFPTAKSATLAENPAERAGARPVACLSR
jgi:hypothetical protein